MDFDATSPPSRPLGDALSARGLTFLPFACRTVRFGKPEVWKQLIWRAVRLELPQRVPSALTAGSGVCEQDDGQGREPLVQLGILA